jgi:hypothetical protein
MDAQTEINKNILESMDTLQKHLAKLTEIVIAQSKKIKELEKALAVH